MQNVLIVSEAKSHMLMSILGLLKNASYNTIVVPADTDAIDEVKEKLDGILIFISEELTEQQQALYFIKDRVITYDIPVFTIGSKEGMEALRSIIPKEFIYQEFVRPIDMHVREIVDVIGRNITQHSMQVKKKILVVDDSGAMLRNVKGWLEDKYDVYLANSGAMAIKYLTLNRPDLLLLDYEMPVCDGKQVLEMIRAEMDFADIPVIFLTSKGDKESIMGVKDLKPEGYLLKSIEPSKIVKSVDDFFEKRKALIANK